MGTTIHTEIEIEATPAQVWDVLTDFPAYPQWNPFVVQIEGQPVVGAQLRAVIKPEGSKGMTFTPTVVEATVRREFRWRGTLVSAAIMEGEHRFCIESGENGRVRFVQAESFRGIFAPLILALIRTSTLAGFNAMNRALKERSERMAK